MKRKLSIIILLTLFLSSCGIPTVYNFDSLIDFSYSDDNKKLTITFDNTNADKAAAFKTIDSEKSPSIIYLYTITSEEYALSDSLKSEFKKRYVGDNKFGTPIIVQENEPLFSVDNDKLKLYVLNKIDNKIIAPTYSEKLDVTLGSVSPTKTTVDIPITDIKVTDDEIKLKINKVEYYATKDSDAIFLNIYAAVNAIGDFSNIYWTELHKVTSINLTSI